MLFGINKSVSQLTLQHYYFTHTGQSFGWITSAFAENINRNQLIAEQIFTKDSIICQRFATLLPTANLWSCGRSGSDKEEQSHGHGRGKWSLSYFECDKVRTKGWKHMQKYDFYFQIIILLWFALIIIYKNLSIVMIGNNTIRLFAFALLITFSFSFQFFSSEKPV
jgi:hypothetical protein